MKKGHSFKSINVFAPVNMVAVSSSLVSLCQSKYF